MYKAKLFIFTVFFVGLMFCLPVFAQTETTTTDNPVVTATETTSAVFTTSTGEIVSNWKLMWQTIKEQIVLLTTLDPVVKVEKLTEFAQQRMEMAQSFADKAADKPELQQRAQQMMEKAEKFMQKVVDRKDKIVEKQTERAQKALQNAADQNMRRDEAIKRIEEKLSPENMQKLEEMRLRGLENSQRLINAIGNENISSSTKAHLEEVKARIEAHLLEVKTFVETKKELLEKVKAGDPAAIEELKNFRQQRNEIREENREETRKLMDEKKEVIKEVSSEVREVSRENRTNSSTKPAICTQEAKICPDGSSVGRIGPNCEFANCPAAAL